MKKILILGGSGFLGRDVCELAARERWCTTVPTRRLREVQAILSLPLLQPVEMNVHDDAALASVMAGHDAVVNLVAILHGNEAAFRKVHIELPQRIARARAGCLAILFVAIS